MFCELIEVLNGGLAPLLADFIVKFLENNIGFVSEAIFDFHAGRADEGTAARDEEGYER